MKLLKQVQNETLLLGGFTCSIVLLGDLFLSSLCVKVGEFKIYFNGRNSEDEEKVVNGS